MEQVDLVVVGAGLVGLATAHAWIARRPADRVVVLEAEERVATHQSGRSSGVLHSGIYYAPGSAKARLSVRGKALMERLCDEAGIPWRRTGKVIVATRPEELPGLDTLAARAEANGVRARRVGPERLIELEPHVRGVAALEVPDAGVADFHAVAGHLTDRLALHGASVRTGHRVVRAVAAGGAVQVVHERGALRARHVVAAAGLHADRLARRSGIDPRLRIVPFRGEYLALRPQARHLCRGLVYPVPDPAFPFLGVHVTRGVDGGVTLGPNAVLAGSRHGYGWGDVSLRDLAETLAWRGFRRLARRHARAGAAEVVRSLSRRRFVGAARTLIPAIALRDVTSAPAGVRAQAVDAAGHLVDDFRIVRRGPVWHVVNAPSPAATSALAIAEDLVDAVTGVPRRADHAPHGVWMTTEV